MCYCSFRHYMCLLIPGSCVDAGFTGCCTNNDCEVFSPTFASSCYCDVLCYVFDDCCEDITDIGCHQQNGIYILYHFDMHAIKHNKKNFPLSYWS